LYCHFPLIADSKATEEEDDDPVEPGVVAPVEASVDPVDDESLVSSVSSVLPPEHAARSISD
jgi:hypothetical protein